METIDYDFEFYKKEILKKISFTENDWEIARFTHKQKRAQMRVSNYTCTASHYTFDDMLNVAINSALRDNEGVDAMASMMNQCYKTLSHIKLEPCDYGW